MSWQVNLQLSDGTTITGTVTPPEQPNLSDVVLSFLRDLDPKELDREVLEQDFGPDDSHGSVALRVLRRWAGEQ